MGILKNDNRDNGDNRLRLQTKTLSLKLSLLSLLSLKKISLLSLKDNKL